MIGGEVRMEGHSHWDLGLVLITGKQAWLGWELVGKVNWGVM